MFTDITSIEELKQIALEGLFNTTDKATKIADNSVLNGMLYSESKIGQKALAEIALIESAIFPELAEGDKLDAIASRYGVAPRFGPLGSSTYVRLVGVPDTFYDKNILTLSSIQGINFELEENVIIPTCGFCYAKIRSQEVGEKTNVEALSITKISPLPNGHTYLINEYAAFGARNDESDFSLLQRIKSGPNILARTTLEFIKEILLKYNRNVLRVVYQGVNTLGKNVLKVLSQNGADFTSLQLTQFENICAEYLSLTDIRRYDNGVIGLKFENAEYYPIDISCRIELYDGANVDDVRKEGQLKCNKLLDLRTWYSGKNVEWEDLLLSMRSSDKIKHLQDNYFVPKVDQIIPKNKFPRIRGFLLLDLNGNLLSDSGGLLNPIYYPNQIDFNFQYTLMQRN